SWGDKGSDPLSLVGDKHFEHTFAKVGTPLLELMDPATVLPAAKVIRHSHDHHHTADQREEIRECENDGEFLEEIRWDEISVHMDHGSENGDDGTNHHLQTAVRVLPCQVHDLHGNLSVLPLDCILLVRTPARTWDDGRHLFVLFHQVVVFTARHGVQ